MNYAKIINDQEVLYHMTGLNRKLFFRLVAKMQELWEESVNKNHTRKDRKRAPGAGRPYRLPFFVRVLMVLIRYRRNESQIELGLMFDIDASTVSREIFRLEPMLAEAADPELKANILNHSIDMNESVDYVATDATEQECIRSSDHKVQEMFYSGKTKSHSIKTQLTTGSNRRILHVSCNSYPGAVHDITVFRSENIAAKLPKNLLHLVDLGYLGTQKDNPDFNIQMPVKRSKYKKLSLEEKKANRQMAQRRIIVEHSFAHMKKYQILSNRYCGCDLRRYNQIFRNVAALINFRRFEMA